MSPNPSIEMGPPIGGPSCQTLRLGPHSDVEFPLLADGQGSPEAYPTPALKSVMPR